jgi:hypothetical protein
MKKLFVTTIFFLFLFPGVMYSGDKDKYHQSDKARERYMKKVERKIAKQKAAFFKKQHKAEIRRGKHANGLGNHYDNMVK